MNKTLSVVILSTVLAACGGGSENGAGGGAGVVTFNLDSAKGPECYGTDALDRFEGSFLLSVNCRWFCADYKGNKNAYVSITFERRKEPGASWVKDHEYISDGIC